MAAALAVYNLNFQRIASGDTVAAGLIPFSVWLDGSVAADRFYPYIERHLPGQKVAFHVKDGRAYSGFPIALPLLITPLYGPAALAVRAAGWDAGRIVVLAAVLEKLMASLLAALSVAMLYLLARRVASPAQALAAALIYAFATETWAVSSQALWQHGGGQLSLAAALYSLVRFWEEPGRRRWLLMAGAAAGLAAAIRPSNALFLAAAALWLPAATRRRADWAAFLCAPAVLGAAVAAYNLHVFGRASGGNPASFQAPFWPGLAGVLLSPGRGLFIYTPAAVFAVAGAVIWLRNRNRFRGPVWPVSTAFAVSLTVLVSKWPVWWGGHCWGPRLLADAAPAMALLVIPAMDRAERRRAWRGLLTGAVAASVVLQALGAFCYPNTRWDETPVAVGSRPGRLWDWKDSPITRSLRAGPRLGPDRQALPLLRRAI